MPIKRRLEASPQLTGSLVLVGLLIDMVLLTAAFALLPIADAFLIIAIIGYLGGMYGFKRSCEALEEQFVRECRGHSSPAPTQQ